MECFERDLLQPQRSAFEASVSMAAKLKTFQWKVLIKLRDGSDHFQTVLCVPTLDSISFESRSFFYDFKQKFPEDEAITAVASCSALIST